MGGDEMSDELDCPICMELMHQPISLNCGHSGAPFPPTAPAAPAAIVYNPSCCVASGAARRLPELSNQVDAIATGLPGLPEGRHPIGCREGAVHASNSSSAHGRPF